MGASKNRGTPKWMVKIMENPIKMDDLGGKPTIFGNIQISLESNSWNLQQIFITFSMLFGVSYFKLCLIFLGGWMVATRILS